MMADPMQYDTDIHLVTMAGNEHIMRTNLAAYEDLAQLEHDIICFLPTVSDINVFGCQADLIAFDTRLPLTDDFHTVLLQQRKATAMAIKTAKANLSWFPLHSSPWQVKTSTLRSPLASVISSTILRMQC